MMNYKSEILRKNRTFFTKSKILEKVVKQVQDDKLVSEAHRNHKPHFTHSTHLTHAKRAAAAFTLAEVLITLGIIGIVAAMTIPTLIVKYEKKQTVTKLQKMYSILNQAYLFAKADGGDNILLNNINGNFDMDSETAHKNVADFMENYFLPHLKVAKNCGLSTDNACFGEKHNSPSNDQNMATYKYNVILQDGSSVSAVYNSSKCDENGVCMSGGSILFWLDINGTAKPNMAGKDYFLVKITPDSGNIEFYNASAGNMDERTALLEDCNNSGWRRSCAALIKYDGWKISDDYDW